MRILIVLILGVLAGGCSILETPCGRVAGSICTIPGEEQACKAVRAFKRGDEQAQKACESAEPIAVAYAKDPSGSVVKIRWKLQRVVLLGAGVVDAWQAQSPEKKLEESGRKAKEAAQEAGQALGEMFDDLVKDKK